MVGSIIAENVFGQLLICLRMSKLDYMVKETPYSAYLTIRKKFVKSMKEETIVLGNESVPEELKNVIDENTFLKKKIGELEKEFATLKVDYEELDINLKVAVKDKISVEDDVEDAYAECRELRKKVENISVDKCEIEKMLERSYEENVNLKQSVEKEDKYRKYERT